jgi:hypothetical protein
MTKSRRGAFALLFISVFTAVTIPVFAKDRASFYYTVAMDGFSSDRFTAAEYADLSASIEFAKGNVLNPAFSMRWLVPVNPFSLTGSLVGLGVDITLFYLQDHPLAWMSPRRMALAPLLSAAAYVPITNPKNPLYSLSLAPFRLFAGYGYFSVGTLSLVFDASFDFDGWGLRLFEFSYLVF